MTAPRTARLKFSVTSRAVTPGAGLLAGPPGDLGGRELRSRPRPRVSTSRVRTSTTAAILTGCGSRWLSWTLSRTWGSSAEDTTSWWMRTGAAVCAVPPAEHAGIVASMAKGIQFANTLVAFRRQAWTEAGGYPEVADLEDLLLWIKIASGGWRFASIPEPLGEHFVHPASFFHRSFKYADRQRALARVQAHAVRELAGLPTGCIVFALGRYTYAYCPTALKRVLRRTLAGSQEEDF